MDKMLHSLPLTYRGDHIEYCQSQQNILIMPKNYQDSLGLFTACTICLSMCLFSSIFWLKAIAYHYIGM